MKKQIGYIFVLIYFLMFNYAFSQEAIKSDKIPEVSQVFLEQAILPIKLAYSIKYIKKNTNDTTYVKSNFSYQLKDSSRQELAMLLRVRGNFRLMKCYFPPLKIKFKKALSKNTIFEGNKSLKIVLPCLQQEDKNDNVIREYLAYKLFEIVSPYHFKTRLIDVTFEEEKGKKIKVHRLKGFLIEDDKTVAKRLNGKVYDGFIHPFGQESKTCVRNAFFQYMIGNTDFSQSYRHNVKLLFIDKKMVPIPYDFDMAGLVNASYAQVAEALEEKLGVTSVTQRIYRGFKRDKIIFTQVRQEFIERKPEMLSLYDDHAYLFENPKEFKQAKDYLSSFFDILENDETYTKEIILKVRKI